MDYAPGAAFTLFVPDGSGGGIEHRFEKVSYAHRRYENDEDNEALFVTYCWLPDGESKDAYFNKQDLERGGTRYPFPLRGGAP